MTDTTVPDKLSDLGVHIAGALPRSVTDHKVAEGELIIAANAPDIVKVATFLRDDERCRSPRRRA